MRKIVIAAMVAAGFSTVAPAQNCNNSVAFNSKCVAKPTTQNLQQIKVSRAALPGSPRIGDVVRYNGKLYKLINQDGASYTLVAQGGGN